MTRRKPGKRRIRTGNEEDPNKRPRRTAQLSSLPEATNVRVETDQQYLGCSSRGTQQEVGVPPGGAQSKQVQPPGVHAGSPHLLWNIKPLTTCQNKEPWHKRVFQLLTVLKSVKNHLPDQPSEILLMA